ncbi:hypothetical protein BCY90_15790 [Agrobacterium deltaense]|nr:hypothetical protein L901_18150 [Agrobacterium sp. D14]RKF41774.1 hypothetical protein BCY90_15790 [Agrobacterium deltaense]
MTAEAICYARHRRQALESFLADGRVEIDASIVERATGHKTITRKIVYSLGSEGGGRTWETLATLLQTCKMNSVDPIAWLTQTQNRIANGRHVSEHEALVP